MTITWPDPATDIKTWNTSLQSTKHHHHGTAEGAFTAKKWFGHRAGWLPCAHSIGKFFLCYIVLFLLETSAPGLSGHYWYIVYQNLCLEDLCACSLAPKTSKISLAYDFHGTCRSFTLCKNCRCGQLHLPFREPSWQIWTAHHLNVLEALNRRSSKGWHQDLARNHVGQFSENQWC